MSCIFNNNFLWSFDISLISGFQNPFYPWESTKAKQGLMCHRCNCVFPADQAQDHLLLLKHAQTPSKPLFICFILIFLLYIYFLFKLSQFSVNTQVLLLERWGTWTQRTVRCSRLKSLSHSNLVWAMNEDSQTCHSSEVVFCSRNNCIYLFPDDIWLCQGYMQGCGVARLG